MMGYFLSLLYLIITLSFVYFKLSFMFYVIVQNILIGLYFLILFQRTRGTVYEEDD